jgi:hypothetical protein
METKNNKSSVNAKSRGELTVKIGKSLKFEDYDVFYDHDMSSENVGRIVSYFGDNERGSRLSYLDIAIVEKNSNKAIALVEIEETNDRPKTLIGDAFGVLMGEIVAFQDKPLKVGQWTTLIIVGFCKVSHERRNQHIRDKVEMAKSVLGTKNSAIGKVVIETFSDDSDEMELSKLINKIFKECLR